MSTVTRKLSKEEAIKAIRALPTPARYAVLHDLVRTSAPKTELAATGRALGIHPADVQRPTTRGWWSKPSLRK